MKTIVATVILAVSLAEAVLVTLLHRSNITEELIKNPRYLIYRREDGLFEVEDLEKEVAEDIHFNGETDVNFYIYNNKKTEGTHIKPTQLSEITKQGDFTVTKDTMVIIHGWKDNHTSKMTQRIKNAVINYRDINIIVIDWADIASRNYQTAKDAVVDVGNYVAGFLNQLPNLGYSLTKVTVVGHSLGAHVAGVAGQRVDEHIGVIVGLDPAGPLFTESVHNNRLDHSDADYVHVIHTNDNLLGPTFKMGDVDYYPNGGSSQHGCGHDVSGTCANHRAYKYYAESIISNRFKARKCGSYELYKSNLCNLNPASFMGGYPVTKSANGEYYLKTHSKAPFAKG